MMIDTLLGVEFDRRFVSVYTGYDLALSMHRVPRPDLGD